MSSNLKKVDIIPVDKDSTKYDITMHLLSGKHVQFKIDSKHTLSVGLCIKEYSDIKDLPCINVCTSEHSAFDFGKDNTTIINESTFSPYNVEEAVNEFYRRMNTDTHSSRIGGTGMSLHQIKEDINQIEVFQN